MVMKHWVWQFTISAAAFLQLRSFRGSFQSISRTIQRPSPPSHETEKKQQYSNDFKPVHSISPSATASINEIQSTPFLKSNGSAQAIPEEEHSELPTTQTQEELIPIEENSTIASDIVKIWHEADSKQICVEFKRNARCPHPSLVGRLSGPALAMLEWKENQSPGSTGADAAGTVMCGGYDNYWLDAGDYFVQIVVLFCKDFGANALQRTNDLNAWLEADHAMDCPEDAKRNQIISEKGKSIIHIATSVEGRENYQLGRWIRKHGPSRPLTTRYQPVECFRPKHGEGSPMDLYCKSITERDNDGTSEGASTSALYEYEFQWNMQATEEEFLEKIRQRIRVKNIPKICGIGDSHSRLMYNPTLPNLNLTGLFEYVRTPWPNPDGIVNLIARRNCDVFFSQVGQWPASYLAGKKPFSFGTYYEKLKLHVQNILKFSPKATVYLPTMDPHPITAKISLCHDWRTPTLLAGYSHVNQMIVQELNTSQVKYIDTNFIIDTHWDGNSDWYHLMEVVRARKTMYMAAIMLGETQWFE